MSTDTSDADRSPSTGPLPSSSAGAGTDRPGDPGGGPLGWRGYLSALGPGLVTGASDDDPSGIATYSQAGARYQYGLTWLAVVTFPMMATVQEICDRTALATGKNLGELCRVRFGRPGRVVVGVLLAALLVANTLNITTDVLAVGAGMNLLGAGPVALWAVVAGLCTTVLVMTGSFQAIARVFKVLCVALLAYLVVLAVADVDWRSVLAHTLVPRIELSAGYVALVVAVLGTTISPYLFFWQSAHRVEDLESETPPGHGALTLDSLPRASARRQVRRSRFDVFFGIAFSNLVMFAIIVATGSTLGAHGSVDVGTAADAADALRPLAGNAASWLFALGFVGSGMLAIPVLAGSASTGLAGLLDKPWGFSQDLRRAPLFYVLVAVGTLGGTLASLTGVDPMSMLVVVAIINGVAAGPFLVVVMLISGDRRIMGRHRNRRLAGAIGWATTAVMVVAAFALAATALTG